MKISKIFDKASRYKQNVERRWKDTYTPEETSKIMRYVNILIRIVRIARNPPGTTLELISYFSFEDFNKPSSPNEILDLLKRLDKVVKEEEEDKKKLLKTFTFKQRIRPEEWKKFLEEHNILLENLPEEIRELITDLIAEYDLGQLKIEE